MNKLNRAAIATGLFAAGAYGAIELDNSTQEQVTIEKMHCYNFENVQAEFCTEQVDEGRSTQYLGITALELGFIAGTILSGRLAIQELTRDPQNG